METETRKKKERINIRPESGAKSLIERAASLEGKTASSFMLQSALERAEKTVEAHETTHRSKSFEILKKMVPSP